MHDVLVGTHKPERLNAALWPSLSKCMNIFECVYSTLNMRKAAQLLHMSLGAVSYNIKTLEEALDMKMFARRGRNGLVVTDDGQKLHDYAKQMKALNKQVADTFDNIETNQQVIKIVAHPLAMPVYVMPAIAKIDKKNLDYPISFSIKSRDDALEDVLSGKSDIAIYPLEWSQVSKYQDVIDFVKVAPYKLMLYTNNANKLLSSKKKSITWDTLKELNVVTINSRIQFYTAKNFLKQQHNENNNQECITDDIDLTMLYRGIILNMWSISTGREFAKLFDCTNLITKTITNSENIGIVANWFICSKKNSNTKNIKEITKFIEKEIEFAFYQY